MSERHSGGLKLDELAERAGVSARTVRYYVQRGLLPAPEFRGPDTAYTDAHLTRLRAIRALQERHLPLDAIQAALAERTIAEVERIARGEVPTGVAPPVPEAVDARDEGRWRRWALAPGLELHVSEGAAPEVRALATRLRREAARGEEKK